jgi:3-hydroxybutyryl-CoA dehydrogenase
MTQIRKVGIAGGGLMGAGIAHVSALAGFETIVREVSDGLAERARHSIEASFAKAIEKGKSTTAQRDESMARLAFVTSLDAFADCDLVIEAIVESLPAKQEIWRALDTVAQPFCIFATNTSSLSVAEQARVTTRGDRFVGMHFFNPVPAMRLVEIVRTVTTSDATVESSAGFVRLLGKEAIIARDTPGFVVNLLLVPYMLDAVRACEQGVASVRDIDVGMQLGAGHPMGPLALCDYVGLDTLERVAGILYDGYRERRYAPPPLLRRMVASGWLGRKNGRGFYDYSSEPPVPVSLMG